MQPDTQREAPAHQGVSWTRAQTRQLAGEGRQAGQRKEPQNRRADNKGSNRAHTGTARRAKEPERRQGETAGKQNQHQPTSHKGQHMQGTTRQPKRKRAAQTIHVRSKVRLTKERQEDKTRKRGVQQYRKERSTEMN